MAAQDVATADALFEKGYADMKAGQYETGCKAIADAQRIDPQPGTLYTLATCEEAWGHVATAASRYAEFLTVYERLPADKKAVKIQLLRSEDATSRREKLLPLIPHLTLSLPADAPAGTLIERNGEVVPDTALGLELPVDPGMHTLSTRAPGGPITEQRIEIGKGEKKAVTLEVKPAPTAGPLSTAGLPPTGTSQAPVTDGPANTGPSSRRVAAYVTGGVGLAGLVAGAVLGGLAIMETDTLNAHCGAASGRTLDTDCDPTGYAASNRAKGAALGSDIALPLGAALTALGLVLFLTEKAPEKTDPGAPAAGRRGRWLSAGVLSAGPAGASLGVSGAF